ncbi:arginine-tRNA-protein transferase [Irpex lacteus]|nr:arginine-tRNA-protein transferase [Irpex lacteus]
MPSIVSPLPPEPGTCGYCGPPGERSKAKTNHHAGSLMPIRLTCEAYQKMIDRGWRRSGEYCYKPDLKRACCPQYTIRLDALEFKPTKSQRKLVNRFNRWILYGDDHDDKKYVSSGFMQKGKSNDTFVLEETIHYAEQNACLQRNVESKHKFEKYQRDIHKEKEKKPSSFTRFLVDTPLMARRRADAMGIMTSCRTAFRACTSCTTQSGKVLLGEAQCIKGDILAREIHQAGATEMGFLYMVQQLTDGSRMAGFYIYSCPKMRYKGEYSPSYLADPEEYSWHRLEECIPLLQKNRTLHRRRVLWTSGSQPKLAPVTAMPQYLTSSSARRTLQATIEALGEEILEDMWFYIMYEM